MKWENNIGENDEWIRMEGIRNAKRRISFKIFAPENVKRIRDSIESEARDFNIPPSELEHNKIKEGKLPNNWDEY